MTDGAPTLRILQHPSSGSDDIELQFLVSKEFSGQQSAHSCLWFAHILGFCADISSTAVSTSAALVVSSLQLGEATLAYAQANDRSLFATFQRPHPTTFGHDRFHAFAGILHPSVGFRQACFRYHGRQCGGVLVDLAMSLLGFDGLNFCL